MTSLQALKINIGALQNNQNNIGTDLQTFKGTTNPNSDLLGKPVNSSNPDDKAYFFGQYADQPYNKGVNLTIGMNGKGGEFLTDMQTYAGDDGYLTTAELQKWLDDSSCTANVDEIMPILAQIDSDLIGNVTSLVSEDEVPEETQVEEALPEETISEETQVEETLPEDSDPNANTELGLIPNILGAINKFIEDIFGAFFFKQK